MDKDKAIINNPKLDGQVGENAVWDGPLSKKGFPMGVGSSSGLFIIALSLSIIILLVFFSLLSIR